MIKVLVVIFAVVALAVGSTPKCNYDGYRKSGCFKRNEKLFHEILITDLDPTHDKWGKEMDWANLQDGLQSLACRCEAMARNKGFSYFAIGFYGECWAGKDTTAVANHILNPGVHDSSECVGGDYGICDHSSSEPCAGVEDNEYIYEIIKTTPPPTPASNPATAPPPPPCLKMDTDYMGYDITITRNVASWQDCGMICHNHPGCMAWTYATEKFMRIKSSQRHCFLKNGNWNKDIRTGAGSVGLISGQRNCPLEYKFQNSAKTWEEAAGDCKNWGGDLAIPTSLSENNYLKDFLKGKGVTSITWIGLNDKQKEGRWIASSGRGEANYFNWNKGEPNNLGSEHCGMIYSNSGLWNDMKCSNKVPYTCQKGFVPQATYKYVGVKKTWANAQADCKAWGGHLAHVTSQAENDQHLKEMRARHGFSNAWIGLTDEGHEGKFTYVGTNARAWYTFWNKNEPNNLRQEHCVHMFLPNGLWNDLRCTASLPYICQKDGSSKVKDGPSSKYVLEPRASKTWSEAAKDCQERGGDLATITSKEENDAVMKLINSRFRGLNVWLGINDMVKEGRWMLSNGLGQVKYTNWHKGEPNNLGKEHCAIMYGKHGTWNDTKCSKKYAYVCQVKK